MRYRLLYLPEVQEDIRHLSPDVKRLVMAALDEIQSNPHAGLPLARELMGLWKYPARRYRIVYQVLAEKREIVVFLVDRREAVYERAAARLRGL